MDRVKGMEKASFWSLLKDSPQKKLVRNAVFSMVAIKTLGGKYTLKKKIIVFVIKETD
jgi:hypothetical protein